MQRKEYTGGRKFSGVTKPLATKIKPRAVIPVLSDDEENFKTAKAFLRAGGKADILILNEQICAEENTLSLLLEKLKEDHIVLFPDEFLAGERVKALLKSAPVAESLQELLSVRDGLALGIGNGAALLMELGLLPQMRALPVTQKTGVKAFSNLSPWLMDCKVGEVYAAESSSKIGAFTASEEALEELFKKGQVAFLDENGRIDGVTSEDGRVLGKVSLGTANALYQNLGEKIFTAGLRYYL